MCVCVCVCSCLAQVYSEDYPEAKTDPRRGLISFGYCACRGSEGGGGVDFLYKSTRCGSFPKSGDPSIEPQAL